MTDSAAVPASRGARLWGAYRMRLKRRRLLWRALRSRHQLKAPTRPAIPRDGVLAFVVLRNESARLPYFLDHYRDLGVAHFLMIDNDSDDGSTEMMAAQPDVTLWQTSASYRASRFGLDWLNWLLWRHGHGRWCLTVDADELLVYDQMETRKLPALTDQLERKARKGFGTLMLDIFPKGPLGAQFYAPGQAPAQVLDWFDPAPYRARRQWPMNNLWVQGGARERVFFADRPTQSPTLNKIPLIRWHRRYVYVNSTHSLLPPALNDIYDGPGGKTASGVLLHSKFLPEIIAKSRQEKARGQHFHNPAQFDGYYDQIADAPDLWHADARRYTGPADLEDCDLMRSPWA
ncbi:glycosyltransferase family 2 protein [Sulfitobacter sp. R86518]|uniref:glycosyltransferase family 2 protein n=1 Tax=Sulfitobacter sp. R86518 TaxID=3093858 RepID=UPI0036DDAB6A